MASIDELKGLAVDERCRLVVVGTLLALLGYLTCYSHAVLGAETVFTHLFYIPIVLVCLWWKRYCLVVAVFLAALLMSSHLLFISDVPAVSDLVRACMFIVVGIVAAFISERLARTGEALRKSEQKFRELADSLPQVVFEADESGIITFVNRNAFIQFGYTQEDFDRGINSLQCLAPDDRDRATESIQRVLSGADIGSTEYTALRKDGSTFPALIHSAPIVHEGRVVGLRGIIVDLTERKRAERAQAELTEILRLLNSILRHDILNDLNVVGLSLEAFENKGDKKYIQSSLKAVDKSVELINDMRGLEQLVSRGEELKPLDVRGVVDEVIEGYSIDFSVEGDCTVLADEALRSVIDNIVRNATLHSGTDRVEFRIECKDGFCEIRIADFGIGIPDELKQKVFEEGFRHEKTGHTGLGLYIVKKVIGRYGGEVFVEDNEPTGAVFVLRLKCWGGEA